MTVSVSRKSDCSTSELIVIEAFKRIEENPHLRSYAFAINVTHSNSDLILHLSGKLPSFYLKQILQSSLANLDGIKKIQNEVEVSLPAETS